MSYRLLLIKDSIIKPRPRRRKQCDNKTMCLQFIKLRSHARQIRRADLKKNVYRKEIRFGQKQVITKLNKTSGII